MKNVLYLIITGLLVSLIPSIILRIAGRTKKVLISILIVSIIICVLLIVFWKPDKDITNQAVEVENTITWKDNKFGYFIDDRDKQIYKVVKIGNQIWMAENLKFKSSGNNWELKQGDTYKDLKMNWKLIYDDLKELGCGRLYNWEDAQNACPNGWHIPTKEEWNELELNLGISTEDLAIDFNRKSSTIVAKKLWAGQSLGFNAFPCGWIFSHEQLKPTYPDGRVLLYVYDCLYLWTSTQTDNHLGKEEAYMIQISKKDSLINIVSSRRKECYFSVRCIKDN